MGLLKKIRLICRGEVRRFLGGYLDTMQLWDFHYGMAEHCRNTFPERCNRIWCGDVTYVRCGAQWLYLALVIDLYKRRIVGWAVSDSPDSSLTHQALTVAYYRRGRPGKVMFHSDQGCHYTSEAYRKGLKKYGIKQSMSRRGNCWDNGVPRRHAEGGDLESSYAA